MVCTCVGENECELMCMSGVVCLVQERTKEVKGEKERTREREEGRERERERYCI